MGQPMAIWRTVLGLKVPTLQGTEASLSYVQCFLYLVSSINVSIFHITRLETIYALNFGAHKYCNTLNKILINLKAEMEL